MREIFEYSALFFLVLLLFFVNYTPVFADGMVVKPEPYSDRWDYRMEESQQAFINYKDGLEKMVVGVSLEESSRNSIWLFPVPCSPDEVSADVVTEYPDMKGENVVKKAKSELETTIKDTILATQIYPLPFLGFLGASSRSLTKEGYTDRYKSGVSQDVTVHEHLEKHGMAVEIITAENGQDLYGYLKNKGLNLKNGSIPVLDSYIGKEFTFIVSWISKSGKLLSQSQTRGIFTTFSANRAFYPLRPTSVYGSREIPITIRVVGHVSPNLDEKLKHFSEVKYFSDSQFKMENSLESFFSGNRENLQYTKIRINAPSKFLKKDLRIDAITPLRIKSASLISRQPMIIALILLILISGGLSIGLGLIMFEDLRKLQGIWRLAALGLSNCFTILGLGLVLPYFKTKSSKKRERLEDTVDELRKKGYVWKRRLAFLFLLLGVPCMLIFGSLWLQALLSALAGSYYMDLVKVIKAGWLVLIPAFAVGLGWWLKKIKEEDQPLFDVLNQSHYSTWRFLRPDPKKFIFFSVFSISFLGASWLIIKSIESLI